MSRPTSSPTHTLCASSAPPHYLSLPQQPAEEYAKRLRALVGSAIGSDLSFVFHKKKRLLAHKIFLVTFSDYFRPLLTENATRKYVEVTKVLPELEPEVFIDYLRLVYSNWDKRVLTPKSDAGALIELGFEFQERRLLNMFTSNRAFNEFTVGGIYKYSPRPSPSLSSPPLALLSSTTSRISPSRAPSSSRRTST